MMKWMRLGCVGARRSALGADERRRKETREKLRQSRGKSTSQTLGNFGVSGRIFARFRDPPTPRRAATGTRETNDERHD